MPHSFSYAVSMNLEHSIKEGSHERYPDHLQCFRKYPDFQAMTLSKGLDKHLQEAEQLCALEVNYFDDTARTTNTSLMSEATDQVNESSENNIPPAKQESMKEVESVINILESLKIDTCHTLQPQPVLRSTSQHCTD